MKAFVSFLSAFRIASAFAIIPTLLLGWYWTSFVLYVLASLSDFFDGSPFTAHTTNIVPFILVSEQFKNVKLRDGGVLADVAPTLLEVMGETQPVEMTGKSLIIK